MKNIGLYIHIPFCKRKCYYCDFCSFDNKKEGIPEYFKYLNQELKEVGQGIKEGAEAGNNDDVTIDTIYIGGGTPSYVDTRFIEEIMQNVKKNFEIAEDAEITIEINPGTVDEKKLKIYKKIGINRCSIGMQATSDELLETIGRIHNKEQFMNTYELARKAGFNNINIDFIIGLPKQNMEDIDEMLNLVKILQPEHISMYSLILEEDTKLKEKIDNGILELPDDELERQMYWKAKNELQSMGYKHYEISNFAKVGYEAKHNLNCWDQKEYIGFGIGAHSYTDNVRYSNISNLDEYIENYRKDKQEDNILVHEKQDIESQMKEYIMLGLRKIDGISCSKFNSKFNKDVFDVFGDEIQELLKQDLIEVSCDCIKLTNKGIDFANLVWQEFV